MIRKGYINRWESRAYSENQMMDYWFCEFAKDAAYWNSREEAEMDVALYNRGISIPSAQGGIYTIRDFQVEEHSPGVFLIFCEAPLAGVERSESYV